MTVAGLAAVVTVVRAPAVLYSVTRRLARVTALCCGVCRLMRDSCDRVTWHRGGVLRLRFTCFTFQLYLKLFQDYA